MLGLFGGKREGQGEGVIGSNDASSSSGSSSGGSSGGKLEGGMHVRSDIHVLVVGDPGLGKSQLLRAAAAVAPRSVFISGNTATTAGLTVAVSREGGGKDGDMAIEAGALILADQGVCCIDELDKISCDRYQ